MYVCTRLNVGVELKGHSPACSLDWSSAGSHQAHQAPHPPSHAFPSHFSLCSSLLTPSFPMNQLFPFAQAGFSMHLSSVIKNVSSPPPCSMLDWRSPSQAQQGTGCPQIRPTILTWKGATSGEWRTVGVEAHVCMCLPIFICKYRFVVSAWWLCVSVQWVLGVSGVWYLWKWCESLCHFATCILRDVMWMFMWETGQKWQEDKLKRFRFFCLFLLRSPCSSLKRNCL